MWIICYLLGSLWLSIIISAWQHRIYKNILKLKAVDRSAEFIDSEFYIILTEKDYCELLKKSFPTTIPVEKYFGSEEQYQRACEIIKKQ